MNTEIFTHEFKIGTATADNTAVYTAGAGAIKIGTGAVTIYGGENNIGLTAVSGDIESKGNVTINGGKKNIGIYVRILREKQQPKRVLLHGPVMQK